MLDKVGNLIYQYTADTGTGDLSLNSSTGWRTFEKVFGTANTFRYVIRNQEADEWEIGEGTITDTGDLSRDTVIESSSSGTLVDFSSGTKDVVCDIDVLYFDTAAKEAAHSITETAGVNLSGHRAVIQNWSTGELEYADNTNLDHMNSVLGITTQAANSGNECEVRIYGPLTEPTWDFTDNLPVFLSTNGYLTQNKPTSGFMLQMGFPIDSTTLMVDLKKSIKLS